MANDTKYLVMALTISFGSAHAYRREVVSISSLKSWWVFTCWKMPDRAASVCVLAMV